MGKLDVPYAETPMIFNSGDFWHIWCCDCGLRHTYFFSLIRGKEPEDDIVKIWLERDDWATGARKAIKRYKKQVKKLKEK